MAITRPSPKVQAAEAFIGAAPDARRRGVMRGRKEQITVTMTPDLLTKLDALATRAGQSRAALINLAVFRLVDSGAV